MIYRTYLVPSVEGCAVTESIEQEQLVNELTPDVNGSLLSSESTSFYLAPGDNVVAMVRIVPDPNAPGDPTTIDTLPELNLSQAVVPQAVDTEGLNNGETEPQSVVVLAPSLPELLINAVGLANGTVGISYAVTLGTTGGDGSPINWTLVPGSSSLPPGLSLTAGGQIIGTPTTAGVFPFEVRAQDDDQVAEGSFSITIDAPPPPAFASTTFRADFDFSAEAVTGPYICFRTQWQFDPANQLIANTPLTAQIFDSHHGPAVGNFFVQLPFDIDNVGHETSNFVVGALADGIGHLQIQFGQPTEVTSLLLLGHEPTGGTCFSGAQSNFVTANVCNIDQSYDAGLTGGSSVPGLAPLGQSFTPAESSFNAVDLYLNLPTPAGPPSGDVFVRIRSGNIAGPIIATSSNIVTVTTVTPVERYRFKFAPAVAVTPGSPYVIEVVHSANATVGVWGPGFGQGMYPGGTRIINGAATPNEDISFELGTCRGPQ